jgi:hypothetical protein
MAFSRKLALAGLVWLTAAMTLVAGLPHWSCRCDVGPTRRETAGHTPGAPGCPCCGCCAGDPAAGESGKAPCCARKSDPRPADESDPGGDQIHPARCVRDLAPAVPAGTAEKGPRSDGLSPSAAPPDQAEPPVPAPPPACGRDWQLHSPAPPTDLVTVLLHLLI